MQWKTEIDATYKRNVKNSNNDKERIETYISLYQYKVDTKARGDVVFYKERIEILKTYINN